MGIACARIENIPGFNVESQHFGRPVVKEVNANGASFPADSVSQAEQ